MLNRKLRLSVLKMTLVAGVFMILLAPSAMAQGRRERCDNARGGFSSQRYDSRYDSGYSDTNNNRYDSSYYNNYNNRYNNRANNRANDYYYGNDGRYSESEWENENTTGKALSRVGIGAAIGAGAGVLLGGKTGALVGAGAGALGGYIYHRGKVNGQQSRYPY